MTLLVRDEIDIVQTCLDFHLRRGVDHVIATDNGSVDGTRELLDRYRDLGRLTLIDEPADDYDQSAWVTRMARQAATVENADWVINVDADEFWLPHCGDFKSLFARMPSDHDVLAGRTQDFLLLERSGQPLESFRFWSRRARKRKVAHRASEGVSVEMGNHRVAGDGLVEHADPSLFTVLHVPHRSFAQFERKVVNGGAAVERNTRLGPEVVVHWRARYRAWQEGRLSEVFEQEILTDRLAVARGLAGRSIGWDRRLGRELRRDRRSSVDL